MIPRIKSIIDRNDYKLEVLFDDGNSKSKLDATTNLIINSITNNISTCAVNITFNYNGKFEGATNPILSCSTTHDSSKATYTYDTYNSTAYNVFDSS